MGLFRAGVSNCFAVIRWPLPVDWVEMCSSELEIDLEQFSFDLLGRKTIEPAPTSHTPFDDALDVSISVATAEVEASILALRNTFGWGTARIQ